MMKPDQAEIVLNQAMDVGEQMLSNGAEVHRVENTIRNICMAYGAARVDVFSITSFISATLFVQSGHTVTSVRRIVSNAYDLHRVQLLTRLVYRICAKKPALEEIPRMLAEIETAHKYTLIQQMLIFALVSSSFTIFFDGDWKDVICSMLIGMVLKVAEHHVARDLINTLCKSLLCSLVGGTLSHLVVALKLGSNVQAISIGNIMLFIPGIAFTNSLRDLMAGDTVTGLIRLCESLLTAVVVALGFTLPHFMF